MAGSMKPMSQAGFRSIARAAAGSAAATGTVSHAPPCRSGSRTIPGMEHDGAPVESIRPARCGGRDRSPPGSMPSCRWTVTVNCARAERL